MIKLELIDMGKSYSFGVYVPSLLYERYFDKTCKKVKCRLHWVKDIPVTAIKEYNDTITDVEIPKLSLFHAATPNFSWSGYLYTDITSRLSSWSEFLDVRMNMSILKMLLHPQDQAWFKDILYLRRFSTSRVRTDIQ